MQYLEGLNAGQKEAVLHTKGPLLIIAGAGAGKTKTLTSRMFHLIKSGTRPSEILAITFTNKAAKEMRDRVVRLIREDKTLNLPLAFDELPFVSTFHALGVHVLRRESRFLDLPKHFTIADDDDSLSAVKEAVETAGLNPKQFEPRRMKNAISRQKGELMTVEKYAAGVENEYFPRMLVQVWEKYEQVLRARKSLDFDDLILKTVHLLEQNAEVRAQYRAMWRFIHIDEYQDTNTAQYRLSLLLAGEEKNICVVGDMDQSIYAWRGADFRNIMNFERDFPHAKTVLLEENYRSTKNILDAANAIIQKNTERKDKNLFTQKTGGEKIGLYAAYNEEDEANFIAEKAREIIGSGVEPKDIAVLYRANFQSRVLEDAMLRADIPYQVLGVKFFARKEVKDILSFVRAALNPESSQDIARAVNVPPRGIGKVTLAKMLAGQEESLPPTMREKIKNFYAILSEIQGYALTRKPSETITFVIKRSGMETVYKAGTDEDRERLENAYELAHLAEKYDVRSPEEGIMKLLEDAALASDQDSLSHEKPEHKNAVRLMTVHASKGLEFPYVFVSGLEEDLFPHRSFSDTESADRAEEERRLFYVAVTRAEKKLFLSFASVRTIFGSRQVNIPSEFLSDIPEDLMEAEEHERIIRIPSDTEFL